MQPEKITRAPRVGKVLHAWCEEYIPQYRTGTRRVAKRVAMRELLPLHELQVTKLSSEALWDYVKGQIAQGKQPSTIKVSLAWLRRACVLLWRRKIKGLPWKPGEHESPVPDITEVMEKCVREHSHLAREVHALSPKDCALVMTVAREKAPAWSRYLQLAIATGMRRSEIRALKWECVDFEAGTVRTKFNFSENEFGPPKRKRSDRVVRLSPGSVALLRELREDSLESIGCDYVFHIDGLPLTQAQVGHAMRAIFAAAEERGLRKGMSLHSARRFYVTQGRQHMPDSWVQAQVGQSPATMERYDRTSETALPPELSWADF